MSWMRNDHGSCWELSVTKRIGIILVKHHDGHRAILSGAAIMFPASWDLQTPTSHVFEHSELEVAKRAAEDWAYKTLRLLGHERERVFKHQVDEARELLHRASRVIAEGRESLAKARKRRER